MSTGWAFAFFVAPVPMAWALVVIGQVVADWLWDAAELLEAKTGGNR